MRAVTIELISRRGPYRQGSRCIENGVEHWLAVGSADSAIPGLARKLVRQHGYSPETVAIIVRDGMPVFATQSTLQEWGAKRFTDDKGTTRVRRDGWREFPTSDMRSLSAGHAENDASPISAHIAQENGPTTIAVATGPHSNKTQEGF